MMAGYVYSEKIFKILNIYADKVINGEEASVLQRARGGIHYEKTDFGSGGSYDDGFVGVVHGAYDWWQHQRSG
jgi:hypothetical protein